MPTDRSEGPLTRGLRGSARLARLALLIVLVLTGCDSSAPTPQQILADEVVTLLAYQQAGQAVVNCMTALGFDAEMELDGRGTPSFTVGSAVGSDAALETCHQRHVGDVELAWADQNAPEPEQEAMFYNAVVTCVEKEVGEELGEFRTGDDSTLLDEVIAQHGPTYDRCLIEIANPRPTTPSPASP